MEISPAKKAPRALRDPLPSSKDYGFDQGNFLPVKTEGRYENLKVEGKIPLCLDGLYVRNGTNSKYKINGRPHMFDGDSMLHSLRLKGGKVAYYTRQWVKPPRYHYNEAAGRDLYASFGDISHGGPKVFEKIQKINKEMASGETPKLASNERANPSTSTCLIGNRFYACTEVSAPFRVYINPQTGLLTSGQFEHHQGATEVFSAHSRKCPATGETHYFARPAQVGRSHVGRSEEKEGALECSYGVFNKEGRLKSHMKFPIGEPVPGFIHDYFLTKNYAIMVDHSLRFDGARLKNGAPYTFKKEMPIRFAIVKRGSQNPDQIRWITTDKPGFVWHVMAGWEEESLSGDKTLQLWMPFFDSYPSALPIHLDKEPHSYLTKVIINLDKGKVTEWKTAPQMEAIGVERGDVNRQFFGRKQRYAYLMSRTNGSPMYNGFVKYDLLEEKISGRVDYGPGKLGGECFFVAANGGEEDSGYLIDIVHDHKTDSSQTVIYDAKSLLCTAKIHMPERVPFGVHANWLSPKELMAQWQPH